jgi:hypothetical protein
VALRVAHAPLARLCRDDERRLTLSCPRFSPPVTLHPCRQLPQSAAPNAASGTDRRDEFRKYLERKKVTNVLTETLTDLFEMENRPEDPLSFLHKKLADKIAAEGGTPAAVPDAKVEAGATPPAEAS